MTRKKVKFIHQYEKVHLAMGLSEEELKEARKEMERILPNNNSIHSTSMVLEKIWNSNLTDEQVIWALVKWGENESSFPKPNGKMEMGIIQGGPDGMKTMKIDDVKEIKKILKELLEMDLDDEQKGTRKEDKK
jgi:hypothetical protein